MSSALGTGEFKLLQLELRNFKGQQSFTLTPDGASFTVYGDNETGKTTLADAFFWLLLDKDSEGRKDFGIKTIDPKTEKPVRGMDHVVYGKFKVGEKIIELQKTLREVWKTKRGQAQLEYGGNTTLYEVNGVPVTKSEYEAWVREHFNEKLARLLGDPNYFPNDLHWGDRRNLLLEICGDVSEAEVIKRNRKLADLPNVLGDLSIADLRKKIAGQRVKLNEEKGLLPSRMDEVRRQLPTEDLDVPDLEPLRSQLSALLEERATIASGGAIAEKNAQLATIRGRLAEAKAAASQDLFAGTEGLRAERDAVNLEISEVGSKKDVLGFEIDSDREALADMNRQLDTLREAFRVEKQKVFHTGEIADVCVSCGQALPADKVEDARAKAEEAFNAAKSNALEANRSQGRLLAGRRDALVERIQTKETEHATWAEKLPALEAKRDQLSLDLSAAMQAPTSPSPIVTELEAEEAKVKGELESLKGDATAGLAEIDGRIATVQAEVRRGEQLKAQDELRIKGEARLIELEARERQLAGEIEELDRQVFLTEEFIRTKVKALEERINARFTVARFKLFREQANGGLEEICEAMIDGVPYADLNHASKINVGLDCINTLSAHFGLAMPVWVDNAESVTRLLPTTGQQVRLVVSKPDKVLRVELDQAA